jgi:hypothetical protein
LATQDLGVESQRNEPWLCDVGVRPEPNAVGLYDRRPKAFWNETGPRKVLAQHRNDDIARPGVVLSELPKMSFGDMSFLVYEIAVTNVLKTDDSWPRSCVVLGLEVGAKWTIG